MTTTAETTNDPTATDEPECCDTPMLHNSFAGEWECADAYFYLVDEGVFNDGESFLRVDLADLTPDLRERHEHWKASCVPDGWDD